MKQQFAAKHPWTILAAGAAIQVLTGLPAAWGVFQQPVMEEYGLSEQGAGYAFGILIAAFGVGCVLGGFLQDRHGPRCAGLWGTALLCGQQVAHALQCLCFHKMVPLYINQCKYFYLIHYKEICRFVN